MTKLHSKLFWLVCLYLSFGPPTEPLCGPQADRRELKLEWIWKMFHQECQRMFHSPAASRVMPLRLLSATASPTFSSLPPLPLLTPSSRSTSWQSWTDQSLATAYPAFQVSTGVFSFSLFLSRVEKASDRTL